MLTTEECPEMNVGTGKFSYDVEMTIHEPQLFVLLCAGRQFSVGRSTRRCVLVDGIRPRHSRMVPLLAALSQPGLPA